MSLKLPHQTEAWPQIKKLLEDAEIEKEVDFGTLLRAMKKANGLSKEKYNTITIDHMWNTPKDKKQLLGLMPFIVKMALKVEGAFDKDLAVLPANKNTSVKISKLQCLILICNQFLCTFDRPSVMYKGDTWPTANFDTLYCMGQKEMLFARMKGTGVTQARLGKIRMILNYLERCKEQLPSSEEYLTLERIVMKEDFTVFLKSQKKLSPTTLYLEGGIETDYESLQADFANKIIGGGTLSSGGVQEEILFCISPECLVTRLFCEEMLPHESIRIKNPEQYSTYKGYGGRLQYGGNFISKHSVDLAAIDSSRYSKKKVHEQFAKDPIQRDLWKCYVGFQNLSADSSPKPIATGSWGSGVFNCDLTRGFIVQWLAASQNDRDYRYYAFGKKQFTKDARKFVKKWEGKTVSELYKALMTVTTKKCSAGKTIDCFAL